MRSTPPVISSKTGRLGVEPVAGLVDVGELHGRAELQGAGVGLLLADDHPEQRGLAGAVRTDDADDAARGQEEGQVVDQEAVAEALHEPVGLDDQVAQARTGRDGDLELVGAPLGRLGFGHELVVGADAGLALGLAGPGRHADPLELPGERLAPGAVRLLLAASRACFCSSQDE